MGFDGFANPPVGAQGTIARPQFKSDNYNPGVSGWAIFRNGNAEFNALGGSFQITGQGIFFYVPTAGSGNLFACFANVSGTDPYGNQFNAGLFINQHQAWITGDQSDTVLINPNGALGPEILFAEAGFPFSAHLLFFSNVLRLEAANASGATLLLNMPVRATGGLQGSGSKPALQPSFSSTGVMVDFTTAEWAPLSIVCPPSETIDVNINCTGFNNASITSTLTVAIRVKQGATTLLAPDQFGNGAVISPEGAPAGNVGMHQKCRLFTVGQDILGGFAGQTITIVPAWRISSGSAATASIDNTASISVKPSLFTQFQSG